MSHIGTYNQNIRRIVCGIIMPLFHMNDESGTWREKYDIRKAIKPEDVL
jgi:hypothetical protein